MYIFIFCSNRIEKSNGSKAKYDVGYIICQFHKKNYKYTYSEPTYISGIIKSTESLLLKAY